MLTIEIKELEVQLNKSGVFQPSGESQVRVARPTAPFGQSWTESEENFVLGHQISEEKALGQPSRTTSQPFVVTSANAFRQLSQRGPTTPGLH